MDRSINSHYATVGMKYTLFNMFERGAAILARGDKALVHTDVNPGRESNIQITTGTRIQREQLQ